MHDSRKFNFFVVLRKKKHPGDKRVYIERLRHPFGETNNTIKRTHNQPKEAKIQRSAFYSSVTRARPER
jgi:hypothetical protein